MLTQTQTGPNFAGAATSGVAQGTQGASVSGYSSASVGPGGSSASAGGQGQATGRKKF